ncbi:leucine zipper transcription factor-like protein 1 isoform X2 [Thrips palmi]|uniref:Leucine zipper transcription factor-like protein 1 n=1 Tax=Thrips palmi TaxID=161013 RepID=A0A6P8ZJ40_THRPL|nr:leucine zipper transcription factor-like protein 1 isoform X2 [Thrips palmi]
MADLSLNETHQELLKRYSQFARYQRNENMKAIQYAFQDVIDSRLLEATYTAEEVREMLTTLSEVVRGDMETELISFAHINVLLIQQLCSQAEKWHLRLKVDLDQLQDQELLEKVKAWEKGEDQPFAARRPEKLEPLGNEGSQGPGQLLREQNDLLRQENVDHQNKIHDLQGQVHRLEQERSLLQRSLIEFKDEMEQFQKANLSKSLELDTSHFEEVENKLSALSCSLKETEEGRQEVLTQLDQTSEQLLQVQSQLQLAEQELERKFSQTAAYATMKKILTTKNEQIKELRKKLQSYEPEDAVGDVERE